MAAKNQKQIEAELLDAFGGDDAGVVNAPAPAVKAAADQVKGAVKDAPASKEIETAPTADGKIDLLEYDPQIVTYNRGGRYLQDPGYGLTQTYRNAMGHMLDYRPNPDYDRDILVDIRTLGENPMPTYGVWHKKVERTEEKEPVCDSFIALLERGKHPLATLGGLTFKEYFDKKVEEATALMAAKTAKTETVDRPTTRDDFCSPNRYYRFTAGTGPKMDMDTQKLNMYQKFFRNFCASYNPRYTKASQMNTKIAQYLQTLKASTPVKAKGYGPMFDLTEEQKEAALAEAYQGWGPRSSFNYDPPSMCEMDITREEWEAMMKRVEKHCFMIPGFKVLDVRKRMVIYQSDGGMQNTPDAINFHKSVGKNTRIGYLKQYVKGKPSVLVTTDKSMPPEYAETTAGVIYAGECWTLHFQLDGKDYMNTNVLYFCTPEQFVAAYKDVRPDLVPPDWKPWSDLIFISTDWCQRNGDAMKQKGIIDLQTPHQQRMHMFMWIMGPLVAKMMESRTVIPGLSSLEQFESKNRAKLEVVKAKMGSQMDDKFKEHFSKQS